MSRSSASRRAIRSLTGGHRLFDDGGHASRFWLIQSGCVALDLHVPGQGRTKIDTIGIGELVGWSWLFPPYEWAFGAVAASPVEAFEFDARAVRPAAHPTPRWGTGSPSGSREFSRSGCSPPRSG